jgi:hypothetical protein
MTAVQKIKNGLEAFCKFEAGFEFGSPEQDGYERFTSILNFAAQTSWLPIPFSATAC